MIKHQRIVEEIIKNSPNSLIKVAEIKNSLPIIINNNELIKIIKYLEEINKIALGSKGICWIYNESPKLKKAIYGGF